MYNSVTILSNSERAAQTFSCNKCSFNVMTIVAGKAATTAANTFKVNYLPFRESILMQFKLLELPQSILPAANSFF